MIDAVILIFAVTILLYVLLGGISFGSGIIDIITGEEDRMSGSVSIGPVWEFNQIWLFLGGIILFIGFPDIYSTVTLHLAIPLLIILIGILLRSTAFFYLSGSEKSLSSAIYKWVFRALSVIVPTFLGVVAGSLALGQINPQSIDFNQTFIVPWFNVFSFSVGFFTLTLFTFLAAVYRIGVTSSHIEVQAFSSAARSLNVIAVAIGVFIFTTAEIYSFPLFEIFLESQFALSMVTLSTVLVPALWWSIRTEKIWLSRFFAFGQVSAVMAAWFWVQMPVVVNMSDRSASLTFYNSAASDEIITQLFWGLIIAIFLILPLFIYMMRTVRGGMFYREKKGMRK